MSSSITTQPASLNGTDRPDVESAPLKNATAGRPYWQAAPCPAWCEGTRHRNGDHDTDRVHTGIGNGVWLTTEKAEVEHNHTAPDGRPDTAAWEVWPASVSVYLSQEYREIEPRVGITHNDDCEFFMTLAEAEELAGILADVIAQARK